MGDIFRRKVWSLSTGKVLDDCETDNVLDDKLGRDIGKADDIRVELTLKNALKLFERKGPDVVEISSQPRLCQEIAGRSFGGTTARIQPGRHHRRPSHGPAAGLEQTRSSVKSHQARAGREAIVRRSIATLRRARTIAGDQQSEAQPKGFGEGAQGWQGPRQVLH